MAILASMIDLREFPKPGIRIPNSLKKRIGQYLLDRAEFYPYVHGKDLSMEGLFAVAVLEFLDLDEESKAKAFSRRIPELIASFEREMPSGNKNNLVIDEVVDQDEPETDIKATVLRNTLKESQPIRKKPKADGLS